MAVLAVRKLLQIAGGLILLFGIVFFLGGVNLFREISDCAYKAYCNPEVMALNTAKIIATAKSQAYLLEGIGIITGAIGAGVAAIGLLMPGSGKSTENLVQMPRWWP